MRYHSLGDQFISGLDMTLRTLSRRAHTANRETPANGIDETELSTDDKKRAAGLMRVNHAGEVCAQALYQGQALTAKLKETRAQMEDAAKEEVDHLAWCEQRLEELSSQPSLLNPLWYGLSFGLGAAAGKISDKVSLGFVAATEEQVCKHLDEHIDKLPEQDRKTRAIIGQMRADESKHAETALASGGIDFPLPVKGAMTMISKVMTSLSYRI